MKKGTLSQATSVVWRAIEVVNGFYEDPITIAYGMGSELGPDVAKKAFVRAENELRNMGWTPRELDAALTERVSAKWLYNSGLNQFFDSRYVDAEPDSVGLNY